MKFWQACFQNMQDNLIAEKVPFRSLTRARQENGSYCGPAVLTILLSQYGINFNQESLVLAVASKDLVLEKGMSVGLMAESVRKLVPGMKAWVKRDSSISDLERLVEEYKCPVIVDWQGEFATNDYGGGDETAGMLESAINPEMSSDGQIPKGDEGHYCVVVEVNRVAGYVRMIDPYGHYAGQDRFFAINDFDGRWWDDRIDTLPTGEKKYVYENKLMFLILPANLRWPEEMGMVEI